MQELFVIKQNSEREILLTGDGEIKEYYIENENRERLEGNIYVGKVADVLPGMQAAFVDIGEEKNAFIHIQDILPKVSNIVGNKEENLNDYSIKDYIKKNDKILVQIKKDSSQEKGARISTHIHMPGRFIVILPENNFITTSQKIENENEKSRLIEIASKAKGDKSIGIIIRTAAEGRTQKEIEEDIINTIKKWEEIKKQYDIYKNNTPIALYKNYTILQKVLLDISDNKLDKIWVNEDNLKIEVLNILETIGNKNIDIGIQKEELINRYSLDKQIEKISNRKIWLKCGGFITIDKTEALTAIDVNSGKYTGKGSLEETVFKVNEQATVEIAKQLRLRDIGGIIIIDYIDMKSDENKQKIIQILESEAKRDRAKTQIMGFTKLELLEITRKHMFSGE